MTGEEWALAAAVVFSGLWSGLLGMLTLVMHPMLAAMDERDFERFLRAFLPVARKAWFNYVCAIGMAVAPIVGLVTLWDDPSSAAFVLCAIGLALVIVGVYVVSNVLEGTPLRRDARLGRRRRHAARVGGGPAALLHAQLDPGRRDLDSVRPLPPCVDPPLALPLAALGQVPSEGPPAAMSPTGGHFDACERQTPRGATGISTSLDATNPSDGPVEPQSVASHHQPVVDPPSRGHHQYSLAWRRSTCRTVGRRRPA